MLQDISIFSIEVDQRSKNTFENYGERIQEQN